MFMHGFKSTGSGSCLEPQCFEEIRHSKPLSAKFVLLFSYSMKFAVFLILQFQTDLKVAEWSRRTYPAPLGAGGVGSIPANSDAQNVPSFRRWRF
jgi:hypothetical protein